MIDWTNPAALTTTPVVTPSGDLDRPVMLIDLDDPQWNDVVPKMLEQQVALGRILIGATSAGQLTSARQELARVLDLTLVPVADEPPIWLVGSDDPHAMALEVARGAAAHPRAARVLAELVRHHAAADAPVTRALGVESYAYSMLLAGPEFAAWLADRSRRAVAPPTHDLVAVTRQGDRLEITLDHAARRNAYSAALRDALVEALGIALLDDSLTQVTLTGSGPTFSAGGDLDEFGTTSDPVYAHLVRTTAGAGPSIDALGTRLTVRVHGPCIGAGVELTAFAAHVVADRDSTFRLPEIAMGLVPGAGGTVSVTRRVGRWRSAFLGLSGAAIDAVTAQSWGLVDEIAETSA